MKDEDIEIADWMPIDEAIETLKAMRGGWVQFPQTKYVELRIDTRDMHCLVFAGNAEYYDNGDNELAASPPRFLIGGNGVNLKESLAPRLPKGDK